MKKRLLALFLGLALCLGTVPAMALEEGDIPHQFENALAWTGKVNGEYRNETVSHTGVFAAAFYLYDILQNQVEDVDHYYADLHSAPEDWGYITMTVGERIFGDYGYQVERENETWAVKRGANAAKWQTGDLALRLTDDDLLAWGQTQRGSAAAVEVGGKTYAGTLEYFTDEEGTFLIFHPETGVAGEAGEALHLAFFAQPAPYTLGRDICYAIYDRGWEKVLNPASRLGSGYVDARGAANLFAQVSGVSVDEFYALLPEENGAATRSVCRDLIAYALEKTGAWTHRETEPTNQPLGDHFVGRDGDAPPYALAAADGTLVTEYRYWAYEPFENGFAFVTDGRDGWTYLDPAGHELTEMVYAPYEAQFGSTPFGEDGLARVQRRNYGYQNILTTAGTELLAEDAYRVWRAGFGLWGFASVEGWKMGFVDGATGRIVVEPSYLFPQGEKGRYGAYFDQWGLATVYPEYGADPVTLNVRNLLEGVEIPVSFTDVAPGDWFAPYVDYVAENGIMIGTGEGRFSPEKTLTDAECLTLAVRLYDLCHGGDGTLKVAPDTWGLATLVTADGQKRLDYGPDWAWITTSKGDSGHLGILLFNDILLAWGKEMDGQTAILTIGDKTWTGVTTYHEVPDWAGESSLYFDYDAHLGEADYDELIRELQAVQSSRPDRDKWYRNTYYTLETLALPDNNAMDYLRGVDRATARRYFAKALALAAGELEKINAVGAIPDLERTAYLTDNSDIYSLYEAGILNGVDDTGAFAPDKTLTRAEAAAMVARVLEPDLRFHTGTTPEEAEEARQQSVDKLAPAGFLPTDPSAGIPLDAVDPTILEKLTFVEEMTEFGGLEISRHRVLKKYAADGIEVITSTAKDEFLDAYLETHSQDDESGEALKAQVEAERGREWVHSVAVTGPGWPTQGGLRVGDTVETARALGYSDVSGGLYGQGGWNLTVQSENGLVTGLYFYWRMGSLIGRYSL